MKKFKKFTSLIGLILTVSILLCFFAGCDLVMEPTEQSDESQTIPIRQTSLQKEYFTEPLRDEYVDNAISLHIFIEYKDIEYTVDDFAYVGCVRLDQDPYFDFSKTMTFRVGLDTHSKENVLKQIKELEKRPDVYKARPIYIDGDIDAEPVGYEANNSHQWAIKKLDLPDAWDISTGSNTVYVGVIDTGVDITHPDLATRVDQTLSKGFSTGFTDALVDGDGHGTHVAGIIGASWNTSDYNGVGGVCWNVKLVSLRVRSYDNTFNWESVAKAINYAEEKGIKILNISGGCTDDCKELREAIESYSGLIICSAGNTRTNTDNSNHYPSAYEYDNIISVGASNENDKFWNNSSNSAKGSNYGARSVDLFAPGADIYSCYPTIKESSGYKELSGTSMAAPFVTGVAALMLAENSSLTPAQIKAALLNSVDRMSAFSGKCVSGGRLNAREALEAVHTTHSYTYSYSTNTSTKHIAYCRCGAYKSEAHTYKITSSTVSCTQCSYSHSHSHAISYTSISPQAHKVTCACGVVAYESHDGTDGSGGVLRCSKCGYGIELWSIDPPVTSQKYTLNEYR